MPTITAVVAPTVNHNGVVDFSFLHYAGQETYRIPWGVLERADGAGSVNPFRGMQQGDWSSPDFRWRINIFTSGHGLMFGGEIDFEEGGGTLAQLLAEATKSQPDFTLLVEASLLPQLEAACQTLGVELKIRRVDVALATSGNPYPSDR
ncbi:MAG TPA: hypothetical protein VFT59_01640 [Candidatus Saccharimonadales bacterium]|nr:hypothetical protein [Candidatus Saccharimonadales bacterium]